MTENVKLVFVGGAPRSGTTLVQRVLNAHPDVYGGPEFDFGPQIMELRQRMMASILRGRISAIVDQATLDMRLAEFLGGIFTDKAKAVGARVFSEKTPANLLVFAELATVIPDAKFICVIRDPRNVVASLKKVRLRAKSSGASVPKYCRSATASVLHINEYIERAEKMLSLGDRISVVYHEDLLRDPETSCRTICDHIGIEYSPSMTCVESSKMDTANTESIALWYSAEQLEAPIQPTQPRIYEQELSDFELSIVERFLRKSPLLQRYGIGSASTPSAKISMCVWAETVRARIRATFIDAGRRIHSRL